MAIAKGTNRRNGPAPDWFGSSSAIATTVVNTAPKALAAPMTRSTGAVRRIAASTHSRGKSATRDRRGKTVVAVLRLGPRRRARPGDVCPHLNYGRLEYGFLRVKCDACRHEKEAAWLM